MFDNILILSLYLTNNGIRYRILTWKIFSQNFKGIAFLSSGSNVASSGLITIVVTDPLPCDLHFSLWKVLDSFTCPMIYNFMVM